jgi:hypothetical protein
MQNEFSKALPNGYSKIDRAPLIKRFEEIMYGRARIKRTESFTQGYIQHTLYQVLNQSAGKELVMYQAIQMMVKYHEEQTAFHLLNEQTVAQKYEADIEE